MKYVSLIVMALIMASCASALEKMQVITLTSSGTIGGVSSLPDYIYTVNGVLDKQFTIIKVSEDGESDLDFYTLLIKDAITNRNKNIPADTRSWISGGNLCSLTPDNTRVVLTKSASTNLCIQNDKEFDVVLRLYDMEANMVYLGDKPVKPAETTCFIVAPNHMYLLDMNFCSLVKCECGLFENVGCLNMNGSFMMKRERSCMPSSCKSTVEYVNWVNINAKDCTIPSTACKETDAGLDIMHFGLTTKGKEKFEDVCLNDNQIQEYYCIDNEIFTVDKYCNQGQKCVDGRCASQIKANETCGVVDGALRFNGDVWCSNDRSKNTCNGNKLINTPLDADCLTMSCSYKGFILTQGQSVCMDDGITIATCTDPLSMDNKFKFTKCSGNNRCDRDTTRIGCKAYTKPEAPVQTRSWSFMDLIRKLFKRDA